MATKKGERGNIGCLVFVALAGLFIIGAVIGSETEAPDDGSTIAVQGTLRGAPDFRIYTNGQLRGVTLHLREYPNHAFSIANDELERTRYDMMRTYLTAGDTVYMVVTAKDFNDTGGGYSTAKVYALRSNTQVYLKE